MSMRSSSLQDTSPAALRLCCVTMRSSALPVQVLQDVTLSIDPGARIAIIGRNGCGKSTLIRLITGTLRQTAYERDSMIHI